MKPSAFETCSQIEARGWEDLEGFIRSHSANGQFVVTDKGNLSKELQASVGDLLFNCKDKKVWAVELKTETENKYGNLFIEYWSNLERYNPGWLFKLDTDLLFYYFQKEKELLVINYRKLRQWAFKTHNGKGWGRLYDFSLKVQKKHEQLNDTWGVCVPIKVVEEEVGLKRYMLGTTEDQQREARQRRLF